jgi:hypothetical protein
MTTFPNLFNVFPGAGGNWQTTDARWGATNISVSFTGDRQVCSLDPNKRLGSE